MVTSERALRGVAEQAAVGPVLAGTLPVYEKLAREVGRPEGGRSGLSWVMDDGDLRPLAAVLLVVLGWPCVVIWTRSPWLVSVCLSLLIAIWPLLFERFWYRQEAEWERQRRLLRAVAGDPGFLAYYQGGGPYDFGLEGGFEGIARLIGRPHRAYWTRVRACAWGVLLCAVLAVVVPGALPVSESGSLEVLLTLMVDAIAFACLVLWLHSYRRAMGQEAREAQRHLMLVNTVARRPRFLPFYEGWLLSPDATEAAWTESEMRGEYDGGCADSHW